MNKKWNPEDIAILMAAWMFIGFFGAMYCYIHYADTFTSGNRTRELLGLAIASGSVVCHFKLGFRIITAALSIMAAVALGMGTGMLMRADIPLNFVSAARLSAGTFGFCAFFWFMGSIPYWLTRPGVWTPNR